MVAFGPDEKQHVIQEEGKIVFLNEKFEKTEKFISIFQNNYQQCGYFFVNDKAVCVYYTATKQSTGKISVYSTADRSFMVGFANQQVQRYQIVPGNQYYFAVKLQYDEGKSYYGSSSLIFFDMCAKRVTTLGQEVQAVGVFRPQNSSKTEVLVQSYGNPCKLVFTYVTYQKASNSLIITTKNYDHTVFINSVYAYKDIMILRGEAGMDGEIYLCIYYKNQVKVICKKEQRDITHITVLSNAILFSTQKPRF